MRSTMRGWMLATCCLAACSTNSPAGGGGAGTVPAVSPGSPATPQPEPSRLPPVATTTQDRPAAPSAAPTPTPTATLAPTVASADPAGAIMRFDVPTGGALSFTRPGTADLTVVVAAAVTAGAHHPFRIGTGPGVAGLRTLSADTVLEPCRPAPRAPGGMMATGRALQQATPPAVGSTSDFWINTGDFTDAGDHRQTCTLKAVTPDLYLYVDTTARAAAVDRAQELAQTFDQIKPSDDAAYGPPPGAGPDGDTHICIVISPAVDDFGQLKGHEGYFWSRDLIAGQAHANRRRAVFVSDDFVSYPNLVVYGVLAHEYQHLLNFTRKTAANGGQTLSEDSWLDEGMSMYAQQVCGYGLAAGDRFAAHDVGVFESDQANYGLVDWTGNPLPAFGQSYLFVRYLVDRFGIGILRELVDNPQIGIANVQTVLQRRGLDFPGVFRDWAMANFLNNTPQAAGTPYHYTNLDLAGKVGGLQLPGFKAQEATGAAVGQLRPWGSLAFHFSGNGPWLVQPGGNTTARLVGAAW